MNEHVYAYAEPLIPEVVSGMKQGTVRYGDERNPRPGDHILAVHPDSRQQFARLKVHAVAHVNCVFVHDFFEMTGYDYPSESPQDVIDAVDPYYDDGVGPGTPVSAIAHVTMESSI